jgi:hypothetical protein
VELSSQPLHLGFFVLLDLSSQFGNGFQSVEVTQDFVQLFFVSLVFIPFDIFPF